MTGIEAVGLVLGILPLILNQLDNYVQGVETVRLFQHRRYRRFIERNASILAGEHAILLNTIETLLKHVTSDTELRELVGNPSGRGWASESLRDKIKGQLGRDYQPFMGVLNETLATLQELSKRLGVDTLNKTLKQSPSDTFDFRQITDILSKSIYEKSLKDLNQLNTILETIASHHKSSEMKADHEADDMTERNQLGRRLANSLCKAVLNPKCWKCPCRAKHQVCLHLADIARSLSAIEFQVVFKTTMSDDDHCGHTRWQRMEVKSGVPDSLKPGESSGGLSDQANGQTTPVTMPCLCLDKHHIGRSMEILNMCDTLAQYSHADGRRTFLGCLREEDIHHPLFIIHCTDGILQSYSLEQLLLLSEPRYSATAGSSHFFSRRDRLYLAPTLACAVLQLHENWLPALWGSQDIHFYKHGRDLQEAIKSPFLTRRVTEPNPVRTNTASAVRNAVLFPLGLALVELSLCSNIASLKTSEDQSPDEITTMFLTANRCMDRVYLESGKRYGDVVQHCLFWSQPGDGDLESAEFRSAVFGRIIRPLIDDVEAFTGTIWPLTGHDISRTS